jgi:hypothetical protein
MLTEIEDYKTKFTKKMHPYIRGNPELYATDALMNTLLIQTRGCIEGTKEKEEREIEVSFCQYFTRLLYYNPHTDVRQVRDI